MALTTFESMWVSTFEFGFFVLDIICIIDCTESETTSVVLQKREESSSSLEYVQVSPA